MITAHQLTTRVSVVPPLGTKEGGANIRSCVYNTFTQTLNRDKRVETMINYVPFIGIGGWRETCN